MIKEKVKELLIRLLSSEWIRNEQLKTFNKQQNSHEIWLYKLALGEYNTYVKKKHLFMYGRLYGNSLAST